MNFNTLEYKKHESFVKAEYARIVEMVADIYGIDLDEEGWKLAFYTRKKALGTCNYTKKTIYISKYLTNSGDYEEITDTVAHELAHAINPSEGHNAVWKRDCIKLGGTGTTTSKAENVDIPFTWELVHSETGEVFAQYYRKPSRDVSTLYVDGRKKETFGKLIYKKVN